MKTASILLVEDSEADVDLFKFCLKKNKIHIDLAVFDNGKDTLDHLEENKDDLPSIILLDINLPGMNGIEILKIIKAHPDLKTIPVVMLTSSKHDEDILKAYSNHANCFVQKPLDLKSFQNIIDRFEEFWFTIVTLPKNAKQPA